MIGSVAAYLTQTADSIARREVDAKLHSLAARLCIEPADPELVSQAIALLGARVETLHAAAEDVERVRVSLAHLATVLKFAEERWNARRTEISELLLRDTMAGIQAIVGDWFEAVTHGHLEAAARLSSVDLPDGLEVLSARLAVATNALNASNWEAAAGFLRLGSRGIDLGDPAQRVPEATIRGDTQALLVRLALQQGLQDEAEAALGALEGGPEAAALRRRLARLRGEAEATSPLKSATADSAGNVDTATELIAMARKEGQLEVALNAARLAIGAFPALFDVVEELSSPGREPRAELWLAVAERAQREGNREILEQAIERADIAASEADVTQDDFHLLAAIREVQVSAGDMLRLPPDDRVAHLVEAGTYRVAAGLIDHGRLDFERALELEPEHVEASWRLADCLVASAWVEPYSQAQPLIQQAGRLLARGRSQRVPEGLGWKFLTDASLERLRARALSKRARRRTWRALLATCRGILHDPAGSQPWIDLSTTAANLGMALLAEAAARYAIELEPDSEDANDALANALSERGDFAGALELTVPGSGPFQEASRGYFLLRLGRFPEALAALRSVAVNPDWGWAVETMMTALLLTGDDAGARSEAHKALARRTDDIAERDELATAAFAAVVVGQLDVANELLGRLRAEDSDPEWLWTLAEAKLLGGDDQGAVDALVERARRANSRRELVESGSIVLPQITALAARAGTPVPSFATVDQAVVTRQAEIDRRSDPFAELRDVAALEGDDETVMLAAALSAGVLALVQGSSKRVKPTVARAFRLHPRDHELKMVLERIAAGEGLRPKPLQAESELPDGEEEPLNVDCDLPASWFEGHDDPLLTHSLFTRFLPEARFASDISVSVAINAIDDLPPDVYRVSIGGELIEEGRVSPEASYLAPAGVAYLPTQLRSLATSFASLGGQEFALLPTEAVVGGTFADLITMPAPELVARRIAFLVDRRQRATQNAHVGQ